MVHDKNSSSLESPTRKSKTPKVSIGMPVHNGERYLRQALDSLLDQTFTDFELIISDNASTDETSQICLEYVARDERIRYYRNEVKIDPGPNFNRVLSYASGQYFMWAAHDDRWESAFVACLVESLDVNLQAALAFCRFADIDEDGHVTETFKMYWADVFSRSKFRQFGFMTLADELTAHKAAPIYGLMRRDALLECGGMVTLPNISYAGEDILTLLHLLAKWDFMIVDRLLFYYREHSFTVRGNEPLPSYLWQRIARRKSGFQGNLLLFFIRNHSYHSNMRRLIMNDTWLPLYQKLLLALAITFKELWYPIRFLPIRVLRELRILQ